jgi:hypothetical protein
MNRGRHENILVRGMHYIDRKLRRRWARRIRNGRIRTIKNRIFVLQIFNRNSDAYIIATQYINNAWQTAMVFTACSSAIASTDVIAG